VVCGQANEYVKACTRIRGRQGIINGIQGVDEKRSEEGNKWNPRSWATRK